MKPNKGIAVDGGCSGNPGKAYYKGVDLETGEVLFNVDIGIATNNIAEFMACCHALYYVKSKDLNLPIYSDSNTAIAWVKNKRANTTFTLGDISMRIDKANEFLQTLDRTIINKWDTKSWGEIPADFGLK